MTGVVGAIYAAKLAIICDPHLDGIAPSDFDEDVLSAQRDVDGIWEVVSQRYRLRCSLLQDSYGQSDSQPDNNCSQYPCVPSHRSAREVGRADKPPPANARMTPYRNGSGSSNRMAFISH